MKATKLIINGEEQELSKVMSVNGQEGDVTVNDVKASDTAPSSPTEGMVWYDTANDVLNVYDGTQWNAIDTNTTYTAGNGISITNNEISADTTVLATKTDLNSKQDTLVSGTNIKTVNNESLLGSGNITISAPTYTAGDNVQISSNNVISATDTTYNAGEGIEIGTAQDYSAMQGPAPTGYHIPSVTELQTMYGILVTSFGLGASDILNYLKVPLTGLRDYYSTTFEQGETSHRWSCSATGNTAYDFYFHSTEVEVFNGYRSYALSIRAFKDKPIIPSSSRTTIYDGTSVAIGAGIFYNATAGLISMSSDGQTWITIQDKNLGATTAYNQGDVLTDANCGYVYQWGNCYGFSLSGTISDTSSEQVDTSDYGPGNYYSSSTFIAYDYEDWSSDSNIDLRGGETGVGILNNAINNTGVLSVNGQTGNVTIPTPEESNTKTFYLSSTSDLTTAQAVYDWYDVGKNPIIVYNNDVYVCKGRDPDLLTQLAFWSATWAIGNDGYEIPIIYLKVLTDTVTRINLGTEVIPTGIQNDTTGTTTTVTKIRAGTEAEYNALQTHSANIIYHIY